MTPRIRTDKLNNLQRTPIILKNRIQLPRRKSNHLRRKRKHPAQAIRHIIDRQLVQQANDIIRIETKLPIRDRGAEAPHGIEVVLAHVAPKQYRMLRVHGHEVVGHVYQGHGSTTVEPLVWNLLGVVEDEFAAADVRCSEKGFLDREVGITLNAKGREELEEEGCRAVQEDGLGAKVEVGVVGLGLVVAHGHEGCHVGEVEVVLGDGCHHAEEGRVEGEVVGLLEEEVAPRERSVGFEFLHSC